MNQDSIKLKGVTWGHTRGYVPLVATAQRYEELNPDVRVTWTRRSLDDFSSKSIENWMQDCDLVVISHTWSGHIADSGIIEPLREWYSQAFLDSHARHSVGHAHESYQYGGEQWALAIDTASPVASARSDLLAKMHVAMPENWDDLVVLAEQGAVVAPLGPLDTLLHFMMFCASLGEEPCAFEEQVVSEETGLAALGLLRELTSLLDKRCFDLNPIQVYEAMTQSDRFAYCPFAYGYSNYARPRYARSRIKFGDLVCLDGKGRLQGPLGGSGLAISAQSQHKWKAAEYAEFVAVAEMQRGYYVEFGGQPSFRPAWESKFTNKATDNYFMDTLPALDRAFVRPRYKGYMDFQQRAGLPIRDFLMNGGSERRVLGKINDLYRSSKRDPS